MSIVNNVCRRQCAEQAYGPPYGSSAISFNVTTQEDQAGLPSEIVILLERSGFLLVCPRVDQESVVWSRVLQPDRTHFQCLHHLSPGALLRRDTLRDIQLRDIPAPARNDGVPMVEGGLTVLKASV